MAPRRPRQAAGPARRSSRLARKPSVKVLENTASKLSTIAENTDCEMDNAPSDPTDTQPIGAPTGDAGTLPMIAESATESSAAGTAPAGTTSPPKSSRPRRAAAGIVHRSPPAKNTGKRGAPVPRICTFCSKHPVGRAMHAATPCDWRDGLYPLECTNCADYRATNPVGAAVHECQVPRKAMVYRKYSQHHPVRYDQAINSVTGEPATDVLVCNRCRTKSKAGSCDVDPILGLQCTACKRESCTLSDGREMTFKPNLRQGVEKWFRHACESCTSRAGTRRAPELPCTWMQDRTTWGVSCANCNEKRLACLDGGQVVGMPSSIFAPLDWRIGVFLGDGWAELRPNTIWRSACNNCRRDNGHCRASVAQPYSACGRCTAMGIDCVDRDGTAYPIFDLSQVGFGLHLPFTKCRRCRETGRNCDRQRPCDSCMAADECGMCDNPNVASDVGKRRATNCINGRLDPAPGPLYYLAHGYGGGGVTDLKDGTKLEHWIGPYFEAYSMDSISGSGRTLVGNARRLRDARPPKCIPPHATPGSLLATAPTSQITAAELGYMISAVWPDSTVLADDHSFPTLLAHASATKMQHSQNPAATADDPPTTEELTIARHVNVYRPGVREILSIIEPLPVEPSPAAVQALADAEEAGDAWRAGNVGDAEEELGASDRSGSDGEEAQSAADELFDNIPIDPALQPSSPPPPVPLAPFSPPGLLSLDTDSMAPHAMTVRQNPSFDCFPEDLSTVDLLSPSRTQFINDAEQLDVEMAMDHPHHATDTNQIRYGVNPFEALPLGVEMEMQTLYGPSTSSQVAPTPYQRWGRLNPLQDDSRRILPPRDDTNAVLRRTPFSLQVPDGSPNCPGRDMLHGVREPEPEDPNRLAQLLQLRQNETNASIHCQELDEKHIGETPVPTGEIFVPCDKVVHPADVCASQNHDANYPAPVCDECAQNGTQLLVDPRYDPLTTADILKMRSYLCTSCTAIAGTGPEALLQLCRAGINTVYGRFNGAEPSSDGAPTTLLAPDGGSVTVFPESRPMTGCSCGSKLFKARLCYFHRIDNAETVLQQVAAVQEWRVQTQQAGKCAGCLVDNEAKPETPFSSEWFNRMLAAWVCFACGGWVINQPTAPGLVDGWQTWFTSEPESLQERNEDETDDDSDADMANT